MGGSRAVEGRGARKDGAKGGGRGKAGLFYDDDEDVITPTGRGFSPQRYYRAFIKIYLKKACPGK